MGARWSKEEDDFVLKNNGVLTPKEIAETIGRSKSSVYARIAILTRNFEISNDGFKTCSKCKVEKHVSEFYVSKRYSHGRAGRCKSCMSKYNKSHYYKNHDKEIERSRRYRAIPANKNHHNKYYQRRYHDEVEFRLLAVLRARLGGLVKRKDRDDSTCDLLGCSVEFLRQHLESQFVDGMSWDNYGRDGWHIDHKVPCSAFDLSDPEQQKKCFHWSNLQPLWGTENVSKGDKFLDEAGNTFRGRATKINEI